MRRNIKLISLFNFFSEFSLFGAILIIYFARVTGSYALGMSLFSVAMVSSALFEIPTGVFSDYLGRKKTMILGNLCGILAVIFYALGINYSVLLIGALFEGFQKSWYSGNNEALLYETLSESNQQTDYDHYLGRTSSMFQLAAAVGIILGGVIATWSFSLIMWLSLIPQLICLVIAVQIVDPKKQKIESTNIYSHITAAAKKIWSNTKLRLLSLNSIVGFAIGEAGWQFGAAFINTLWPLWAVGFSKVLSSLGATWSFWYSGKLIKKFGAFRLLLISDIYSKIVSIFSVAFPTVASPLLMTTTSVFYGADEVAKSKLMQKEFSDQQRATLGSMNSFLGKLAFGAFAVILGLFADKFGPAKALLFAYVLSLPTLWINWVLFKNNKGE
jgi:MFS family permease